MFGLRTKPSPKEVARGFLISVASSEKLSDIEQTLIAQHGLDENKYRWEARYLGVAATQYAFFCLLPGKLAAKVQAIQLAYWELWREYSAIGEEEAFTFNQLQTRMKTYAPAVMKDASEGVSLAIATEFSRQFDSAPMEALALLMSAGAAEFDSTFRAVTEVLSTVEVKL